MIRNGILIHHNHDKYMERVGEKMNGINYSSLMSNTGLFSNQTVNREEALFKGATARTNKKVEDDKKQTNTDKDTYEYSGQTRNVKAGYERPKRTADTSSEYKALDSNGVQEGVELSDAAKKLLEELRKKYGNMDFSVVEWSSDEEQDYYASKTSKDYSVLINPELLEEMAADESVREKYEAVLGGADEKFDTLKEELGEDADKIKGFTITMDRDGKVSYAVQLIKNMTQSTKTDTAKAREEKIEQRRADRKKAEEERQEKIVEKREETERISADSIEELVAAIKAKLHPEQAVTPDENSTEAAATGQVVTE